MSGIGPKLTLITPGCASRRTSSWFVIDSAPLICVECSSKDHGEIARPGRRPGAFVEHLARPAVGLAVGGDELGEGVRLTDSLAQLVEHELEQLDQLLVPAPVLAGGLEPARALLPLLARDLDPTHCEQHRSGQRGSTSSRMHSPSS